ncbi:MAG: hypothetical protein R3Y24_06080 [Eubacteriales bacterium]
MEGIALVVIFTVCTLVYVHVSKEDLVWENIKDEDGNLTQVLDMSDEELEKYQLSFLEKPYANSLTQFFTDYVYELKKSVCYDYRDEGNHEILVGYISGTWAQQSETYTSEIESFGLTGTYRNLVGKEEMDAYTKGSYKMDPQYDSSIGLFVGIIITKYEVIKKDKSTGEIISTRDEYVMTTHKKVSYPIQISDMDDATISYLYGDSWNDAYMIADGLLLPPQSSDDIVLAKRY